MYINYLLVIVILTLSTFLALTPPSTTIFKIGINLAHAFICSHNKLFVTKTNMCFTLILVASLCVENREQALVPKLEMAEVFFTLDYSFQNFFLILSKKTFYGCVSWTVRVRAILIPFFGSIHFKHKLLCL